MTADQTRGELLRLKTHLQTQQRARLANRVNGQQPIDTKLSGAELDLRDAIDRIRQITQGLR